jgi:hypothetical protein
LSQNQAKSDSFFAIMSPRTTPYEIHSAERGPHWIAWVARPGSQQPDRSVVIVGETREEAEARARAWAESLDH